MEHYDIPAAAKRAGFSIGYIRTLIRNGKIATELKPIHEGSSVLKHMISEGELKRFLKEIPHKSRRSDGRNKYIVYARAEECVQMKRVLVEAGMIELAGLIVPANRLKNWEANNVEAEAED